ncbi:MinD/ParA family ATP-binding protein [Aquipuribacter hungaricus]|uniref:MinD/ParA family ATP-binding protein n=1 Tax=Aquipuribacter hungaricus TaxID=545624 RepID=UPI0030ECDA88
MITVTVADDGTGSVALPEGRVDLSAATPEQVQAEALAVLIEHAARHGQPLDVQAHRDGQTHQLLVHPDGAVDVTKPAVPAPPAGRSAPYPAAGAAPAASGSTVPPAGGPAAGAVDVVPSPSVVLSPPVEDQPAPFSPVRWASAPSQRPAPSQRLAPQPGAAVQFAVAARHETGDPAAVPASPSTRREARQSFLTVERVEPPATTGVRALLGRLGIRVPPSAAERAERDDVQAVSQHWPGRRTIAVVNGKGGAGKTPTTICLAAVFARHGGAGVLAWDHNQTRGTLGWRTEQGPHQTTLLDLLPQADRLQGTSAQAADIARFVHHQTGDRYDVLRSKPMALADEQRLGVDDVDALHAVAAKYYRIIVMDSGNDESDAMWRRMIDLADQIVVATTTRDDHAEAGALLLEGLAARGARAAALADQAVVVVNQADRSAPRDDARRVAGGFAPLAQHVATIPFDPAMVGGHLRFATLRPATQRAWLAAGAAVARTL